MEVNPVVTCPACGCPSSDPACCEYCNANLTPVSPPSAPTTCPLTPDGPLFLSPKQAGLLTRPEASVNVITPDKTWRLHWISSDLWPEWKPRVEQRLAAGKKGSGVRGQEPEVRSQGSGIRSQDSEVRGQEAEADSYARDKQKLSGVTDESAASPDTCPLTADSCVATIPPCRIVEDLTGVWIVAEASGNRPEPWRGPVSEDPLERLRHLAGIAGRGTGFWDEKPVERLGQMVSFLDRLAEAMECLHSAGLVWLPFHPSCIEEGPTGLRATNLDLMVYPFSYMTPKPRVVPAWAPPEVVHDQELEIGPLTDVYHLALVTYYWLSRLLPNGFPGKGLASFEFAMPALRVLAPTLPVSIAGVVMSGLAVEPSRRPASPRTFCAELRARVEALRAREAGSQGAEDRSQEAGVRDQMPEIRSQKSEVRTEEAGLDTASVQLTTHHSPRPGESPVATLTPDHSSLITHHPSRTSPWEIGSHTRTGRAKASKGGVNQDSILIRQFRSPYRALVVVADGLSCCDVGSGDVASRLVCEAIDATFGSDCNSENFSKRIPEACRRGAEAMLTWALDHGEGLRLKAAQDLMSTTVLAAWLEVNTEREACPEVIIANAGDSRAYLINDQGIEQLTVDADLGCTLLAAGSPPENVTELGPVTRALRSCVGGVLYRSATDELLIDDARLRLTINRWRLLPGETLILCSDGLVEEGAFLEPAELLELVRRNADLSAEALAFALAEAADARQSLPSQEEPESCGDNISCCVIRIK